MGNCKDCEFWEEFSRSRPPGWGECRRVRWDANHEYEAEVFVTANDDQGLEGRLDTGPFFGCVLFEERKT